MSKKYVIFKEFGKYKMTTDDNYGAYVRDDRKVTVLYNCRDDDEAMQAAINVGIKQEDIIYA